MSNLPGLNYQLGEDIDALRDAIHDFAQDVCNIFNEKRIHIFCKTIGIGQHSRNSEKYFSKDQCKLFTAAFLQSMGDSFGSFFIFNVYFILTLLFFKFSYHEENLFRFKHQQLFIINYLFIK